MSAWRVPVVSIALLLVAAGVLQSSNVVNTLVFCIVTAPIGLLLLRTLDDPWRVTMLGVTVVPWTMVVRDATALLLVEPAAAPFLILVPLVAGFVGLVAVLIAARAPVRGGYVVFMMVVLLMSLWAVSHPSMS